MNTFTKYKYYFYPLLVFAILLFILLLLKVFQTEVISLVEDEKKKPVTTKIVYPEEIRPQFLFFGRVAGKNEINIVSRLSGKIIFLMNIKLRNLLMKCQLKKKLDK